MSSSKLPLSPAQSLFIRSNCNSRRRWTSSEIVEDRCTAKSRLDNTYSCGITELSMNYDTSDDFSSNDGPKSAFEGSDSEVAHDDDDEAQYLVISPSNLFYYSQRSACHTAGISGLSPYPFSCEALTPDEPSPKTPAELFHEDLCRFEIGLRSSASEKEFIRQPAIKLGQPRIPGKTEKRSANWPQSPLTQVVVTLDVPTDCDETSN